MSKVLSAEFLTTATQPSQYPREPVPEIAFVGRSNVGKSSLINALANRNKLVRVSNTPGRTRTLNFFDVSIERKGKANRVCLCDLPGYGFAKVSKSEREGWREMIGTYLQKRQQLKVVVSIIDAEIGPTNDDVTMLDFLVETESRVLVVATKLDRIPKAKRKPRLDDIGKRLELPRGAVMGVSSTDRMGLVEVWATVLDTVEGR